MSTEEADTIYKRMWTDNTTKQLIAEFKNYYELWKNGTIGRKNQMWQKIAEALNKKGLDCTAGQAENRFKTLQRSYRKACGILPSARSTRRFHHPFTEELSNIFVDNIGLLQGNGLDEEDAIIIDTSNQDIQNQGGVQQFLDESTGSIFTLSPQIVSLPRSRPIKKEVKEIFNITDETSDESNDVLMESEDSEIFTSTRKQFVKRTHPRFSSSRNVGARIDKIINSNEQILNKSIPNRRIRQVPRKKIVSSVTAKTNVDVLLEMKELLKKIEIRRQARHEQNLKIAKERNAIMKRKNELLENLLARQE